MAGTCPARRSPLTLEVISPTEAANPGLFAAAEAVVADWTKLGLGATHTALPPGKFVTERLATGDFQVAIADVTIGLDPDLYPLLASSQTVTGGSNVVGLQDPKLDALLRRPARRARSASGRPRITTSRCSSERVDTCSRWSSRTRSWWSATRVEGPRPSPGHRSVGAILGCANMASR